jgi:hypothetical protein
MTLKDYLQKKTRDITPAESQLIRARLTAGASCWEVAKEIGCVPIQVAAVKANMTRGQ